MLICFQSSDYSKKSSTRYDVPPAVMPCPALSSSIHLRVHGGAQAEERLRCGACHYYAAGVVDRCITCVWGSERVNEEWGKMGGQCPLDVGARQLAWINEKARIES